MPCRNPASIAGIAVSPEVFFSPYWLRGEKGVPLDDELNRIRGQIDIAKQVKNACQGNLFCYM